MSCGLNIFNVLRQSLSKGRAGWGCLELLTIYFDFIIELNISSIYKIVLDGIPSDPKTYSKYYFKIQLNIDNRVLLI